MARNRSNNTSGSGTAAGRPKQAAKARKQPGNNRSNSGGFNAPTAVGTTTTTRTPRINAGGSVRVKNTEYVADVVVGTQLVLDINPVASATFTWLGKIATSYELFRIHSLRFVYTPICSSSTTGVVVMAFDYDASDAPPISKLAMTAYSGSARSNVWNKFSCSLEAPDSWYYCGTTGVTINPSSTDIKLYDPAKFYLSVFNAQSGTVGELTVEYDIEFAKPDYNPAVGYEMVSCTGGTLANTVGTPVYNGTIPFTVAAAGTGSFAITFQVTGVFLLELLVAANNPATVGNVLQTPVQSDPNTQSTITLSYLDLLTNTWTSSSSPQYTLAFYNVNVLAGTVVTFTFVAGATSAFLNRIRAVPSNKLLT